MDEQYHSELSSRRVYLSACLPACLPACLFANRATVKCSGAKSKDAASSHLSLRLALLCLKFLKLGRQSGRRTLDIRETLLGVA